ncbi:DUF5776 domain-containing protein, partial [Apilactobacillus sp. TMW 2.2459]|uniref:DUF5776 domain-containing protein n=1 Tax=Apilactobacillus xinyiensis TaxID=2841032 RepID=UPI00200D0AFF
SNVGVQKAYDNARRNVSNAASQATLDFEKYPDNRPSSSYSSSEATAYSETYGALSQAKSDYNDGKGHSEARSDYTPRNSSAYTSEYNNFVNATSQAKRDYDDKINNSSYASGSQAHEVYSNAYGNMSTAHSQAVDDFMKSGFENSSSTINAPAGYYPAESQTYVDAYRAMSQAVDDIRNKKNANNTSYASRYKDDYNNVYNNFKSAYNDGMLDGAIGLKITYGSYASNSFHSKVYNNAYSFESSAVSDAMSKATNDFNSNKYNSLFGSYSYSQNEYSNRAYNKVYSSLSFDVRKAQLDFGNGSFESSQDSNTPYKSFYNALSGATNDFINGISNDVSKYSLMAKSIYEEQYNSLVKASAQGKSDSINNNGDHSSDYAYNLSLKKVYDDAYNDISTVNVDGNNASHEDKNGNDGKAYNVLNDFSNGINRDISADGYRSDYSNIENGFADGINNKKPVSSSSSYLDGYNMGKDGMSGINHALEVNNSGKEVGNLSGKTNAFIIGFNGFNDGFKAAINKSSKNHPNKGPVYGIAYDKGYEFGLTKLSNRSKGNSSMNKPIYVYNTKVIHAYANKGMHKSNIVKKYNKKPLGKLNELKVVSKCKGKNGQILYKLSDGSFINRENLKGLYYTKSSSYNIYKVIAKKGIHVHSSSNLKIQNRIDFWKKDHKFRVQKVVNVNGKTRFYMGNGQYVTGNKNFVKIDFNF